MLLVVAYMSSAPLGDESLDPTVVMWPAHLFSRPFFDNGATLVAHHTEYVKSGKEEHIFLYIDESLLRVARFTRNRCSMTYREMKQVYRGNGNEDSEWRASHPARIFCLGCW